MLVLVGYILDGKAIIVRLWSRRRLANASHARLSEFTIARAFGSAGFMHAQLLFIVEIVSLVTVRDTLADFAFEDLVIIFTKFIAEDTFSHACFRYAALFLLTKCISSRASRLLLFTFAPIISPLQLIFIGALDCTRFGKTFVCQHAEYPRFRASRSGIALVNENTHAFLAVTNFEQLFTVWALNSARFSHAFLLRVIPNLHFVATRLLWLRPWSHAETSSSLLSSQECAFWALSSA